MNKLFDNLYSDIANHEWTTGEKTKFIYVGEEEFRQMKNSEMMTNCQTSVTDETPDGTFFGIQLVRVGRSSFLELG